MSTSRNATCMALPTNQPIAPTRNEAMAATRRPADGHVSLLEETRSSASIPIYNYAVVTDAEEGLILVDVNTLADGDPRNNHLKRARDLEPGRRAERRAARHAGRPYRLYRRRRAGWSWSTSTIRCSRAIVVTLPLSDARASALQFRYLWVTDAEGLKLFDVTELARPVPVPSATVPLADARRIYLARTYAYVAAKARRPGDRRHHQSRAAAGIYQQRRPSTGG